MLYTIVLFVAAMALLGGFFYKVSPSYRGHRNEEADHQATKATKKVRRILLWASGVIAIGGALVLSIMVIQPGYVGFIKTFGNLSHTTYEAGFHVVNPFANQLGSNIRRRSIDYTGDSTAEGLTKNKVALLVDVSVPWILNPPAAPLLYERYGESLNFIDTASRKAIRDCTATLDWEDAVGESGRASMATCIPERMQQAVVADLMDAGLSDSVANGAFTFPDALVRKMIPKEQRILSAISEEQAAIVDLRRQQTLTAIAEEEANRRANEGSGIRLMMAELPKDFTVAEMVSMIEANAMKTNAEAFIKAVEGGNPNITVITSSGGSALPVTASAN